jgi:hypothetical protein
MNIWVLGGALALGVGVARYLLLQTRQTHLSEEEKQDRLEKHAEAFHRKFQEV